MKTYDNYIGGDWLAGASMQPNVNPSDSRDVIGPYAQADAADRAGHRRGACGLRRLGLQHAASGRRNARFRW